jgi:hypothetical protein
MIHAAQEYLQTHSATKYHNQKSHWA